MYEYVTAAAAREHVRDMRQTAERRRLVTQARTSIRRRRPAAK